MFVEELITIVNCNQCVLAFAIDFLPVVADCDLCVYILFVAHSFAIIVLGYLALRYKKNSSHATGVRQIFSAVSAVHLPRDGQKKYFFLFAFGRFDFLSGLF